MKKTLTTYLEEELIKKLKIKALEQDITLAALLSKILEDYLKKNGG